MRRLALQLSSDIGFAVTSARWACLYWLKSGTVGSNPGVIRDRLHCAQRRCEISFRYKSVGDRAVVNQIFRHREYAFDEDSVHGKALRNYYLAILASGSTPLILDAGANIGASCLYFSCSFPGSRIVAIEPERRNCELLKRNSSGESIHVIEGAIGAEPGTLFLRDPGLSDWGFRVSDHGDYPVEVHTPNEVLAKYGGGGYTPLLFKIDIEGAEAQLFSANLEWIDRFAMLVIELHDWMLPGQRSSSTFLRAIANRNFDFLHAGENVFCFNNSLLELHSHN